MSYPGAGIVGGTHFVLAERMYGAGTGAVYSPDIVFTLFLPPVGITMDFDMPHSVSANFSKVHVESGAITLGNLSVSLDHGVGAHLYTSARTGMPQVMNGLQRSESFRSFIAHASRMILGGRHRLEFHNEKRSIHAEVVPVGSHRYNSSGGSGRVGGGQSDHTFSIIRDLENTTSPWQIIDSFRDRAYEYVGIGLGTTAVYLNMVSVAANDLSPVSEAKRLAKALTDGAREINSAIGDWVSTATQHTAFSIELALIDEYRTLIRDFQTEFMDKIDDFNDAAMAKHKVGYYFNELKYQVDALNRIFANTGMGSHQRFSPKPDSSISSQEKALSVGAETDAAVAAKMNSSSIDGGYPFPSSAGFAGWIPYSVSGGDTLQAIADKQLGDVSLWTVISEINGVASGAFLYPGMILKLPVLSGGFSFSIDEYPDKQSLQDALFKHVYYVDLMLKEEPGTAGLVDLVLSDDLMDVRTVTGPSNYIQRYRMVIFRTDLGSNPEFKSAGVYLGVGEKNMAGRAILTTLSARRALLADPRTKVVQKIESPERQDGVVAAFDVVTTGSNVPSNLLIGGV